MAFKITCHRSKTPFAMRACFSLLACQVVSCLKFCFELSNHEFEGFVWPQPHFLALQFLRAIVVHLHLLYHFINFLTSSLTGRHVQISPPLVGLVLPHRFLSRGLLLLKFVV